jgi:uncharacterized protein (TIGR03118 family)
MPMRTTPVAPFPIKRREFLVGIAGIGLLSACGGGESANNSYRQINLVADDASAAQFEPRLATVKQSAEFLNGWGIAIRPAGAGGHFWVTAGGYSYQFVGDVTAAGDSGLRVLFQDALAIVKVPGAGVAEGETDVANPEKFVGFATGVVFNGAPLASNQFVVQNQKVTVDGAQRLLSGSARFLFATDSGVISGWTERDAASGEIVRRDGAAVATIDNGANGHAYFGIALKPGTWDRLWAADFGAEPQLRAWDAQWQPVALGNAFANPFIGNAPKAAPGDYVPFNIQVLRWKGADYAFVAYAKSQADPNDPSKFHAAEEDALAADVEGDTPDRGRVAMFDLDGNLVKKFDDAGRLNAPWGLAISPPQFGPLSDALLVGNFGGEGRVAAFDIERGSFIEYLKRPDGKRVAIAGLWGLQFGNGASLGDADALYFAAGPAEETQGLFGALRHAG